MLVIIWIAKNCPLLWEIIWKQSQQKNLFSTICVWSSFLKTWTSGPCLPYPTIIYTCGMITIPKVHGGSDTKTISLSFVLYITVVRTTLGITQWNFLLDLDFTIYVCPHLILFLKTHYCNPFPFYASLNLLYIS